MSDLNSTEVASLIHKEKLHISDFEPTNKTNTRWKRKPTTLVRYKNWRLKDFHQSVDQFIERTIVGSENKFPILREVKKLELTSSVMFNTFFNSITSIELKLNLILSMELISYTEASDIVERYYESRSTNYTIPKEKFHDLVWFIRCYTLTENKEEIPSELLNEIMNIKLSNRNI